jgi:hypothetical protein
VGEAQLGSEFEPIDALGGGAMAEDLAGSAGHLSRPADRGVLHDVHAQSWNDLFNTRTQAQ